MIVCSRLTAFAQTVSTSDVASLHSWNVPQLMEQINICSCSRTAKGVCRNVKHSIAFRSILMSDEVSLPEATQQAATTATTIDELVKAAYFVATSIDAPAVDTVSPNQVNLYYPADGSLVSVRIESRAGVWGGIAPHGTPEEEAARNAHYDEMLAANTPPPPPPEGGVLEANPNPIWEVQRQ